MQQTSPVQQIQMMPAGNPTCWWNTAASLNYPHQQSSSSSNMLAPPPSDNNCSFDMFPAQISSNSPDNSWQLNDSNNPAHQDPRHHHLSSADSWSQLLMNGLMSGSVDHEKTAAAGGHHFHRHNDEAGTQSGNWEDNHHMVQYHQVKQEINQPNIFAGDGSYPVHAAAAGNLQLSEDHNRNFHVTKPNSWSILPPQRISSAASGGGATVACSPTATPASSPQSSCVTYSTTGAHNLCDFSPTQNHPPAVPAPPPTAAQCKDSSPSTIGGSVKKAKVQSSSSPSTFKVRKFGDRITTLHQLVSPFGKTDTASVLLEAIGYIRFLQSQIEALSIPYLTSGNGSVNNKRQLHPHPQNQIYSDRRNSCLFPEDPGQLVNENCLKRKASGDDKSQFQEEPNKDLRSRGLCLVPVSCTLQVGSESSAADYWAPAAFGGFGQ